MAIRAKEIIGKFTEGISLIGGSLEAEATAPCSVQAPKAKGLVFAPNLEELQNCLKNKVAIAVIPQKLGDQAPKVENQAILGAKNLDLAMAQINSQFFPIAEFTEGFDHQKIHPSAVISKSAELGENVIIGPMAVIEAGARIGHNCHIHAQAVISRNSVLGDNCIVQSQAVVGSTGYGYGLDEQGQAFHKPHYGKVVLGKNVEIGAGTCIDRGAFEDTTIGDGTKIDNNCHIGHNNIIGKNCMITASFSSAGSSKIGDNCHFAGGFRLGGHIEICDNCIFLGVTTVAKSVTEPGVYGGWPHQKQKDFLRRQSALPHLAEMRKDIKRIKKNLGIE